MAKYLIAVLVACACVSAPRAEIYKYVDEESGAVQYTNQPKKGAVRMNTGDSLSEMTPSDQKRFPTAEERAKTLIAKANADSKKRLATEQAAQAELQKKFPKCVPALCQPEPGMPIATALTAFSLSYDGFSHTPTGKSVRYRMGRCMVLADETKLTAISC